MSRRAARAPRSRAAYLWVMLGFACALPAASRARAESRHDPKVESFLGCWQTAEPAPVVVLKGGNDAGDYQLAHEGMLLSLVRIEQTELVKGHYYAFTADRKVVIGPEYVDGAFNPAEGALTVGEPEGGLNRAHVLSEDRLLYVHTKAAETADMSVRYLDRMDCAEAEAKSKELRAARR